MADDLQMNLMRRFCVGDLIRRTARRWPKKEAFVYSYKGKVTHRLTYEEFNRLVNRFANAMLEMGVKKGDIVGIISHNSVQMGVYLYGIAKIGAWICPLNFALRGKEITDLINHAKPKVLFVEDDLVAHVKELVKDMPSVKIYSMINLKKEVELPKGWIDFDELMSDKYPDTEPEVIINADDVLTLMYTSGTEAMPKGVLNTHGNWYSTFMSAPVDLHMNKDDTVIDSIPLYHVAGQYLFFATMAAGARVVMHHEPSPIEIISLIQNEKVTAIVYPPTVFTNLLSLNIPNLAEFLGKAFGSVKKAIVFGSPIAEASLSKLMELLPNVYFMNYYGQSESTPLGTTIQHPDFLRKLREANEKYGGAEPIGQPHHTVEMKVFDENDNEVPPGTIGELVMRSPSVMLGYYKEPKKTAEVFRNGWLHTGDLGIMDEEGYFYFVDRKKDIVKTGAENVSTVEVEGVIFRHPKVAEATVVGLPHAKWVEAVTAFVVPKPNQTLTEEEIIQYCKENLAGYKVPKKVIILNTLPKNPSGKILKKVLRKEYQTAYEGEKA
ncbi:MAG: AMP-binding protein [Candidatus Freyarchaeota archaeon]